MHLRSSKRIMISAWILALFRHHLSNRLLLGLHLVTGRCLNLVCLTYIWPYTISATRWIAKLSLADTWTSVSAVPYRYLQCAQENDGAPESPHSSSEICELRRRRGRYGELCRSGVRDFQGVMGSARECIDGPLEYEAARDGGGQRSAKERRRA